MSTRQSVDAWGIDTGHWDGLGVWHETTPEAREAILAAMGIDTAGPPAGKTSRPVKVVISGQRARLSAPSEVILEDGRAFQTEEWLPPDIPAGYHEVRPLDDSGSTSLIVSPGRCHLPDGLAIWGWAAQLYAARSKASWGLGDLADLRRLARWSKGLGAGLLLVNPLSAATPVLPQQPSPYTPSSRLYRNPLYIRVEEVPGAAETGADIQRLAEAGRVLNAERLIDRDAVFRLKLQALETIWAGEDGSEPPSTAGGRGRFQTHRKPPAFHRYVGDQGTPLEQFAVFCTLAERHGGNWRRWPAEFQDPGSEPVRRFARENRDRVDFHKWLQWLLDEQLAAAAAEMPVMLDLPVGVDPDGADAWAWQDAHAGGVSVGAPPDEFNRQGQDWGLPPLNPLRLQELAYEPFIQTIRASLRHAGGLRIDHVMGLFRLFWIPAGLGAVGGAYVRYPADDLLAIVALESQRAGAVMVGEDLGTVEDGVRERLADARLLSYRLLWFEEDPPELYPEHALSAITTHDLPTVAGLWTGADLKAQRLLDLQTNSEGAEKIRQKLRKMAGVRGADEPPVVVEKVHRLLARSPSAIVTATLDDALAVLERPNMPGTVTEWPNWSMALPAPLEEIETAPLPRRIAGAFAARTRA